MMPHTQHNNLDNDNQSILKCVKYVPVVTRLLIAVAGFLAPAYARVINVPSGGLYIVNNIEVIDGASSNQETLTITASDY